MSCSIPAASAKPNSYSSYGSSIFASKMGQLAGNHFLTMTEGHEQLEDFGKKVLWKGAQPVEFSIEQ